MTDIDSQMQMEMAVKFDGGDDDSDDGDDRISG